MLEINGVSKEFTSHRTGLHRATIRAVDEVSLQVDAGAVVCVVGESGCGKSTLGRIAAGLCQPDEGSVVVDGTSMYGGPRSRRGEAARAVQMIHQDPFAALNPGMTVRDELRLPLLTHDVVSRREVDGECRRLLGLTGLRPDDVLHKYPHQLSGGQRQRVVIARALTVRPKYLVGDEAVTMVDVSSRLVLLELLRDVCRTQDIGLVFITHDFAVARYIAFTGRIGVMYRGRIVEQGATEPVVSGARHPYTRVLLSAIPPLITGEDYQLERLTPTGYEVDERTQDETGCVFTARCPLAMPVCGRERPELLDVEEQQVACHLVDATLVDAQNPSSAD